MLLRIETMEEKIVVGKHLHTSFSQDKTKELWQGFMPLRKQVQHSLDSLFYAIDIYPPGYFDHFDPSIPFERWAAVEVTRPLKPPEGMDILCIPRGLYAVFLHKGPASRAAETYGFIFGTWLPAAAFVLDQRPHLAVMGEKYKHEDPASEEEIWIPVRPKQ